MSNPETIRYELTAEQARAFALDLLQVAARVDAGNEGAYGRAATPAIWTRDGAACVVSFRVEG